MQTHYINLSNGLEWISQVSFSDLRFMRISSSHCEAKAWDKVIESIPDDFLIHLAIGNTCIIYDCGSRKGPVPRSLWQGMAIARYCIERLWFGKASPCVLQKSGHTCDVTSYASGIFRQLPRPLRRRIKYFKKYLQVRSLSIEYRTMESQLDGKYTELAALLRHQFELVNKK